MNDEGLREIFTKIRKNCLEKANNIPTISLSQTKRIAKTFNLSQKDVEIAALKENISPSRYLRNFDTINFTEQIILLKSKVAVVGCGGLGGNILELLARLGVGKILAVDGDIFQESNLNRQKLCIENSMGKEKATTALSSVKKINSSICLHSYSNYVDEHNIKSILKGYDIVVDALDSINFRFVLEKACKELNVPLIHGAINGLQGQVCTIFPQDKGFTAIYGRQEKFQESPPHKPVSVLSITPALVASLQVAEVLKVLLKRGNLLRNRLLLINLEYNDFNIVEID